MYFNIIYTFRPVFAAGVILSENSTTILIYMLYSPSVLILEDGTDMLFRKVRSTPTYVA